MRLIIAGGRDFADYKLLEKSTIEKLQELKSKEYNTSRLTLEIISGNANGADKLGEKFAESYGLKLAKFPADWSIGKSAGYRRNEQMALYAKGDNGVLIAFWNGTSKGTKHMIDLANKYDLIVFVIKY